MKVSVIIPAFNEELFIEETILAAHAAFEIIVVDCGSADKTVEISKKLGARVLRAPAGRGTQMDAGAASASGDTLLFLHGDTLLPLNWQSAVEGALSDPKISGGGFSLKINGVGASLRIIELGAALRSGALNIIYGDQAIFVKKERFQKIGGFRGLPLMEDVDLVKRLKAAGRMVTLAETLQFFEISL